MRPHLLLAAAAVVLAFIATSPSVFSQGTLPDDVAENCASDVGCYHEGTFSSFGGTSQYCAFYPSGITEGGITDPTSPMRDVTVKEEAPQDGDNPDFEAKADEGTVRLGVSGESENEYLDSREWTEISLVHWTNLRAKLAQCADHPRHSVSYAVILLYYDTQYYEEEGRQVDQPNLRRDAEARTLYAVPMDRPWDDGLSWKGFGHESGDLEFYLNDSATRAGFGGISFGGFTPCAAPQGQQPCRVFEVDVSYRQSTPGPVEQFVRGWRDDFGWAILDDDVVEGGGKYNADDAGTCDDPTHPPPEQNTGLGQEPLQDGTPSTCLNVFLSSDYQGAGKGEYGMSSHCALDPWVPSGHDTWVCWPKLVVYLDPNEPVVDRMHVRHNQTTYPLSTPWGTSQVVSGEAPVNLSVRVRDDWGEIVEVTYTIEDWRPGDPIVDHAPFTKRGEASGLSIAERARCECEQWVYYRHGPLDLPDGDYWVNFTALDSDGQETVVTVAEPNLRVRERTPTVTDLKVTPDTFDYGGVLDVSVAIGHPEDRNIEAVRADIREATTDGSQGKLVKTVPLTPTADVDSFRRGTWRFSGSWGLLDPVKEVPGEFEVWVRANDTLGRLNDDTLPVAFKVRDVTNPHIVSFTVGTPSVASGGIGVQESGGPITFDVRAGDPGNVVPPSVIVRLTQTDEDPVELTLAHAGTTSGGSHRYEGTLTAPAPGAWRGTVTAVDDEGLTDVEEFSLLVTAPEAPVLRSPTPATWGNVTPEARVEVFDYTLDASSIRLYFGEEGSQLDEQTPVVTGTAPLVTVATPPLLDLRHGATYAVRVVAADAAGLSVDDTWTFTVDARDPGRTTLAVGDPSSEKSGVHTISPTTPLALSGSDVDSGLARVEYRLVDVTENVTGAWRAYGATPITLATHPDYDEPGPFRLEYRAVDRVGNVETLRVQDLVVDGAAPKMKLTFDGETVRVVASDDVGLGNITLHYRNASSPAWSRLDVEVTDPLAVDVHVPVGAVRRGLTFTYYATATDLVLNRLNVGSEVKPLSAVAPNHAPKVQMGVADGAVLNGSVVLSWNATDGDGDAIRVVLDLKPVVLTQATVLGTQTGTRGVFEWFTDQWPDGAYDLTLTASDGSSTTKLTRRVHVANTEVGAFQVIAPDGRIEFKEPVTFQATFYKDVREARVKVVDAAGNVVDTVLLNDAGRDGDARAGDRIFTGRYVPDTKGALSAVLAVEYEDEAPREASVGQFTVESTLRGTIERNAIPIILGALAFAAVATVVVVQLIRYGYLFPKE